MAIKQDYYEVMGVPRNASDEEIKREFRKLAKLYHPDRNREPGAEDKFKEINEAYQVLSDHEKRSRYDRYGRVDVAEGFPDFGFGGLGDIFESFFGGFGTPFGRTAQRVPQRGDSLQSHLTLSFNEAVFGCSKEVEIQRIEFCPSCHGIGSEPGTNPETCPDCHGTGQVKRVQQSIFGRFTHITTCSRCGGSGTVTSNPCSQCKGKGRIKVKRKVMVKIPAGVDDGQRLRLDGEGSAGLHGGPPGDLYVTFSVKTHNLFHRDGSDVLHELPINFAQAALGDEIRVPSLDGRVDLKIPPGTQNGKTFRFKGKGIPYIDGKGRGDLLVKVAITTPQHLDKNQRHLFEELAKILPRTEPPPDI
ncbi:MAG: molecular chaperone DnaJ [Dehalococcoidia bacterium]|nr:MAG: molecular chaperone DnaJ [Dehalococcoidia bacterium]